MKQVLVITDHQDAESFFEIGLQKTILCKDVIAALFLANQQKFHKVIIDMNLKNIVWSEFLTLWENVAQGKKLIVKDFSKLIRV